VGSQGLVKDLIKLPFRKFGIILDVDWLSTNKVIIYFFKKRVTFDFSRKYPLVIEKESK
jgi:hypothetical protein